MYDKKKNFRALLEGRPYQHIPISFFQHFLPEDTHGKRCVDAHIRFLEETDFDFLKIMHDGLSAPIPLNAGSLQELKSYRPLYEKNPYVEEFIKRAEGVNGGIPVSRQVDTYCNVFSPITLFQRIEGNQWKRFFQEDPEAVRDILLYMAKELAWMCSYLLRKAGCTGIFLAMQGAETGEFTPEEYRRYIAESDCCVIQAMEENSSCNILHFCGWNNIPNQLELWKDYPGCAVNWDTHVEKLSLGQGRKYFGMRPCMGGFDNRKNGILYSAGKETVEEETFRILEEYQAETGSVEGLIIGGDCSYLPDFETERFHWVTEAVRKWELRNREALQTRG